MIHALFGGLALLVCWGGAAAAADLQQRATEAVEERRFDEARTLYEQLSEQQPQRSDYKNWVARLSGWLGEHERALATYDEVLAWDPGNVDALVGKAYVLGWAQRYDEAGPLLDEAERLQPDDPQIALARERIERNAAWSTPLPPRPTWEGSAGMRYEDFSFADAGQMAWVHGAHRTERTHTFLQVEQWDKFDEQSTRFGVGLTVKPRPRWTLAGEAWTDPGSEVLPEYDLRVTVGRSIGWGLGLSGSYRFMEFEHSRVNVFTGTAEYYFSFPVWVSLAYHRSSSELRLSGEDAQNDSVSFLYHHRLFRRLTLHAGYAYGNETFQDLSIDRVGDFQAQTIHGAADYVITRWLAAGLQISHQERDNGDTVDAIGLSVSVYR
jgi:YaiO family outer membrane protein